MQPEISLEQTQQLNSWVSQRDSILLDLASKKDEQLKLTEANKNLAESNSEIQNTILRSQGRIEELRKSEKERETVISKELSELLIQKSQLQLELSNTSKEVNGLIDKKDELIKTVDGLSGLYEKFINLIDQSTKTIAEFSHANSSNIHEVEMLLEKMKEEFKKIIDVNTQNCEKAERVMVDMPKIVFSLQKDILERKHLNKIKHT